MSPRIICPPMTFNASVSVVGQIANYPQDVVKSEPMLFNCDRASAARLGGQITRDFLSWLPDGWDDVVIDSRVHMLMPGWMAAIPGWHHDDVPRPPIPAGQHFGTAGQPDYVTPRYHSEHLLVLLGADVAPTEFAIGVCPMPEVRDGQIIYGEWSPVVDRLVESGAVSTWRPSIGTVVQFDAHAFHRATVATGSGWRWFCRVSRNTERTRQATNEQRVQVQVYLPAPTQGW